MSFPLALPLALAVALESTSPPPLATSLSPAEVAELDAPVKRFAQDTGAAQDTQGVPDTRVAQVEKDAPSASPGDDPDPARAHAWARFVSGAASALLAHEAGHVAVSLAVGTTPRLKRVDYSGLPFFAITHDQVGSRQELAISSAGFLVQHSTNEWLLSGPPLRRRSSAFRKGFLAMNLATSGAYAFAAFTRTGPAERDTRGVAESLGVAEPWVGGLVLAPAALDAWRYARPQSRFPRLASRALKLVWLLLLFEADSGPHSVTRR